MLEQTPRGENRVTSGRTEDTLRRIYLLSDCVSPTHALAVVRVEWDTGNIARAEDGLRERG